MIEKKKKKPLLKRLKLWHYTAEMEGEIVEGWHPCPMLSWGDQIPSVFTVLRVQQVAFVVMVLSHGCSALAIAMPGSYKYPFSVRFYLLLSQKAESPRDICIYLQNWVTWLPSTKRKVPLLDFPFFLIQESEGCRGLVIDPTVPPTAFSYMRTHNASSELCCHLLSQWFSSRAGTTSLMAFGNGWRCFWLLKTEYCYQQVDH